MACRARISGGRWTRSRVRSTPTSRGPRRRLTATVALRAELKAESEARRAAENALQWERQRREAAERAIADLRQERGREPFVVPALVDAFVALSHATGKLLAEVPSGRKGL